MIDVIALVLNVLSALFLVVFILLGVLVVWTAPNRWGGGIALHYLTRVFWPDPADPVPPPRGDTSG